MNWASRYMILKYLKQLGSFGDSFYNCKIEIYKANQEQGDFLEYI